MSVPAYVFEPFVVGNVSLDVEPRKQFLSVKIDFPMEGLNRGARILNSFLAGPFHDGDEVELPRTRGLLEDEVLEETLVVS
jgi:hypothetical protein